MKQGVRTTTLADSVRKPVVRRRDGSRNVMPNKVEMRVQVEARVEYIRLSTPISARATGRTALNRACARRLRGKNDFLLRLAGRCFHLFVFRRSAGSKGECRPSGNVASVHDGLRRLQALQHP